MFHRTVPHNLVVHFRFAGEKLINIIIIFYIIDIKGSYFILKRAWPVQH